MMLRKEAIKDSELIKSLKSEERQLKEYSNRIDKLEK